MRLKSHVRCGPEWKPTGNGLIRDSDKPNEDKDKDKVDYSKAIEVNSKGKYGDVLKDALEKFEEKVIINVKDYNEKDYGLEVINKMFLENPEIAYGYKGCKSTIYPGKDETRLEITLEYSQTKEEMIKQKTAVEIKVQNFLTDNIKIGMTDVEKEIAIHDYLAKNAEYNVEDKDKGYSTDHNAYGVLVLGKGVCESYAKAFCVLSDAAGLECKYVSGEAKDEGPHAWNMVKLDGEWYNVDVTWDDPVYNKPEDKWVEVQYNYFNVPDSIMKNTHTRDESLVKYPVANGTKYAYKNLDIKETDKDGNTFEDVKDKNQLQAKIKEAIEQKETTLFLKVYDLGMNQQQLLNEINVVCGANKTLVVSRYSINSSGDSIKLVKYSFTY